MENDLDYSEVETTYEEPLSMQEEQPGKSVSDYLLQYLNTKYELHAMYRSFADRLRGPYRDAIVSHWHEHAADQMKSAYTIAMSLISMKTEPVISFSFAHVTESDFFPMANQLLEVEAKGVEFLVCALAQNLASASDRVEYGLRVTLEEQLVLDRHHIDDLVRMSYR